jgi:hypothetical protein
MNCNFISYTKPSTLPPGSAKTSAEPRPGSESMKTAQHLSLFDQQIVNSPNNTLQNLDAIFEAMEKPAGIPPLVVAFGVPAGIMIGKQIAEWATGETPMAGTIQPARQVEPTPVIYSRDIGRENALFDANFYSAVHGISDSNHFYTVGADEGRVATPWVNVSYYRYFNGDIGRMNIFEHIANHGVCEGQRLSGFFDPKFYLENYRVVREPCAHFDKKDQYLFALQHFIDFGMREGAYGSAELSAASYINRYPERKNMFEGNFLGAMVHYYQFGIPEQRNASTAPHESFGARYECQNLFYDKDFHMKLFPYSSPVDFDTYGVREMQQSAPWMDLDYYNALYPDIREAHPVEHVATIGMEQARETSPFFDPKFYWRKYPDLREAFGTLPNATRNAALLRHFALHGLAEGRTGSAVCSAVSYLKRYPDLSAGINGPDRYRAAIEHYYIYGRDEGRDAATEAEN